MPTHGKTDIETILKALAPDRAIKSAKITDSATAQACFAQLTDATDREGRSAAQDGLFEYGRLKNLRMAELWWKLSKL